MRFVGTIIEYLECFSIDKNIRISVSITVDYYLDTTGFNYVTFFCNLCFGDLQISEWYIDNWTYYLFFHFIVILIFWLIYSNTYVLYIFQFISIYRICLSASFSFFSGIRVAKSVLSV